MRQIHQRAAEDRAGKRLLAYQHRIRRQMLDRFLDSQSRRAAENQSRREARVAWPAQLIGSAVTLLEDLRRYLDLCLARFIVWRETNLRKKADQMNSCLESEDEARKGLTSLRRRLRKRESERFVTEHGSVGPAPATKRGFAAVRLGLLRLKGIHIVRHFLSPILARLLSLRGTGTRLPGKRMR